MQLYKGFQQLYQHLKSVDIGAFLSLNTISDYLKLFDSRLHTLESVKSIYPVWDDVVIEPTARTTGSRAPTLAQFRANLSGTSIGVYSYYFDDAIAVNEKEVFFIQQMPHRWKQGTDIHFHIHWSPMTDSVVAADVRWGLEYTWFNIGETFGFTNTIYVTGNEQGDTILQHHKHYITEFGPINPANEANKISSILVGRLFRNSSHASDTYTNIAALLSIDSHYQVDYPGSKHELIK